MWDIGSLLIIAVILIGCVAIAYIACRAMGVVVPDWVMKIGWVIVIVIVAVIAIRFLLTLL